MNTFLRNSGLVCGSLLLTGCSYVSPYLGFLADEDNSPDPTPLVEFSPTVDLEQQWEKKAGSGNDELYVRLMPANVGDRLFAVDIEGHLFAFDKDSGDILWKTEIDKRVTGGLGTLDASLILLGTGDGEIIAFDQDDGAELWSAQLESEVLAPPNGAGEHVIAYAGNNTLYGLNAANGEIDWKVNNSMPALVLRGNSMPLMMGDQVVYVGLSNGRVLALDAENGNRLWERPISIPRGRSELQRMVDINGRMALVNDTLYVVSYQGQVAALAVSTGTERWHHEMSSYTGVSANEDYVAVTDSDDIVNLLSAKDGAVLWKQESLTYRQVTLPVFWEDYVVVGDKEGYLHILSLEDGSFVGRVEVGGEGIVVPPLVVKDALYVLANNGQLSVYTLKD